MSNNATTGAHEIGGSHFGRSTAWLPKPTYPYDMILSSAYPRRCVRERERGGRQTSLGFVIARLSASAKPAYRGQLTPPARLRATDRRRSSSRGSAHPRVSCGDALIPLLHMTSPMEESSCANNPGRTTLAQRSVHDELADQVCASSGQPSSRRRS